MSKVTFPPFLTLFQRLFIKAGISSSNHHHRTKKHENKISQVPKKALQIPTTFFFGKQPKTPKKNTREKDPKQRGRKPGGKNPNGFNGGKNPNGFQTGGRKQPRLTLGSFMGLSLGVTRLSLRGTLFLAFRHLTPHLPFLGIFC